MQVTSSGAVKPARDGRARKSQDAQPGRFHDMFCTFRDELDEHYDRRERVVKASRDVTAQSKKIIFALQRVKHLNQDLPPSTTSDVATRLADIGRLLDSIAPDVLSLNRHRYAFQLRCLEELVEALSFRHYLRYQRLITPEETQALIPAAGVALTARDYMYGVFDLFGEMMRFATVTTAQNGVLASGGGAAGRHILRDVQELGGAFEALPEVPTREYRSKMVAARQSVKKVEMLGFSVEVRGTEGSKRWMLDDREQQHVEPE